MRAGSAARTHGGDDRGVGGKGGSIDRIQPKCRVNDAFHINHNPNTTARHTHTHTQVTDATVLRALEMLEALEADDRLIRAHDVLGKVDAAVLPLVGGSGGGVEGALSGLLLLA